MRAVQHAAETTRQPVGVGRGKLSHKNSYINNIYIDIKEGFILAKKLQNGD